MKIIGRIVSRHTSSQLLLFLFLLTLALVAYRTILNNTFIGDDFALAFRTSRLSVTNIWQVCYSLHDFVRPVPLITWWAQYKLFGFEGMPSHLINVSLHAINAYLIFWFLFRLGTHRLSAVVVALLFVLTPIGPEAVTWSAARFDLMALMFVLLAMSLYWLSLRNHSKTAFAISMVATLLALFSKENAMILAVLFPATEALYSGNNFESNGSDAAGREGQQRLAAPLRRLYGPAIRLSIFFLIFASSLALRYAILGRLGGYENMPKFGKPDLVSTLVSMSTVISPLSSFEFSIKAILGLAIYTCLLGVTALALVLWHWRRVNNAIRRLYLLMVVFLFVSLVPIYSLFFMFGFGHRLEWSRSLYFSTFCFLALLVLGLLEFGWQNQKWQVGATLALLVLLPVYYVGITHNNRPWERSAAINYSIPLQTRLLLPQPPPNAKIYFQNVPTWYGGAYIFSSGLNVAIKAVYEREDLEVKWVDPEKPTLDTEDGFLFDYDIESGILILAREP